MPRKARKISESGLYHIMIRGNEKKEVFKEDEEKMFFAQSLMKSIDKQFSIYAVCIMNNHAHLLGKFDTIELMAQFMKKINTRYAGYYNTKNNRVGHVFQDRFKSEVVQCEKHFLAAVRYIHCNPVKAKLTEFPWQYPWSTCGVFLDTDTCFNPLLIDTATILDMFSLHKHQAKKLLKDFTKQENEDRFMDFDDDSLQKKKLTDSWNDSKKYLIQSLQKIGLEFKELKYSKHKLQRDQIVADLRNHFGLSLAQISLLMNLNKNTVMGILKRIEKH